MPFPPLGDLPDPGIETVSLISPALAGNFFTTCSTWEAQEALFSKCSIDTSLVASLVAQMVKNLLAMLETWVRSLAWEDPLEEGMSTHSSILAWRIPMDRGAAKSRTRLSD